MELKFDSLLKLTRSGSSRKGKDKVLSRSETQKKGERESSLEAYRHYQENIGKSGQLQAEILKGAGAGEDIYSLFLKAVKAISCMTSNPSFLNLIEEDIRAIYGRGLQEHTPLTLELTEKQRRLDKLREAQRKETEPGSLQRIARAATAHEARIEELTGLIERARTEDGGQVGTRRV